MSAPIRSQLGPTMNRLGIYLVAGQALLGQPAEAGQLVPLCTNSEQTRRAIIQAETLLDRWTKVLVELQDNERENEEAVFNNFTTGGNTPAALLDAAQDQLILIDIRIDQLRAAAVVVAPPPPPHAAPVAGPAVQVPTLQLPSFDGGQGWYSFWDAFSSAIHTNIRFTDSQKMTYLYGQLRGPAKALVEGFPLTDANYPIVVDLLRSRYGDNNRRASELQSELLRLPRATGAPGSLRGLSEGVERICRQLMGLGIDTDANPFLKTAIQDKIPSDVRAYLADKELEAGAVWTPRQWRDGLTRAVKVREAANLDKEGPTSAPTQSHPKQAPSLNKSKPPFPRRILSVVERPKSSPKLDPKGNKACSLCGKYGHAPSKCPEFDTADKRKHRLMQQKRCLLCAREGHFIGDCSSRESCSHCGGKHHFIICAKKDKPTSGGNRTPLGQVRNPPNQRHPIKSGTVTGLCMVEPTKGEVRERPHAYLMMKRVPVYSNRGSPHPTVPIFLDPGSQTSFISSALVREISPRKVAEEELTVCGFVGEGSDKVSRFNSPRFSVLVGRSDGGWQPLVLNRTDRITSRFEFLTEHLPELPTLGLGQQQEEMLEDFGEPHILIGVREFWKIFLDREEVHPGLYRIDTVFGSMYGGEFPPDLLSNPRVGNLTRALPIIRSRPHSEITENDLVKQLWSLETIGITDCPNQSDDDRALALFDQSIHKDSEGRYEAELPWKDENHSLSDNFSLAFSRLVSLSPKLKAIPKFREKYQELIDDQLDRQIIEPAQKTGLNEHFLPHHAVVSEKKMRIVYDASAHRKGQLSLNDNLLPGPNLVPDLAEVMVRFRACPLPVLADIEKAFLMVGLAEKDREYTKFLWLRDPSQPPSTKNTIIFRFRRIPFGIISSPFILAATLRHHLASDKSDLAREMLCNMYVDNLLILANSIPEAQAKSVEAKKIMAKAQMRLREFTTFKPEILDVLPTEDRLEETNPKVLGLNWNLAQDGLFFRLPGNPDSTLTRRKVLSTVASFFDPLGLCSPLILRSKIFFQQLWDTGKGWDDPLPDPIVVCWETLIKEWQNGEITVPRLTPLEGAENVQLHIFTDAGPEAYATSVYLRSVYSEKVLTSLIFAKSRLRPLKMASTDGLTIPRLELLGVLIGVRAKNFVLKALNRGINQIYMWVDSQIVLSWLGSTASQPVFVANRLTEIRKHRDIKFRYVRSAQNPADLGTRGMSYKDIINSELWWEGPPWLRERADAWPNEYPEVVLPPEASEEAEPSVAMPVILKPMQEHQLLDVRRFDSWESLWRSVAFVFRFLVMKMGKSATFRARFPKLSLISLQGPLSINDRNLLKEWIIIREQKPLRFEGIPISKDQKGVVRLRTRMSYANGPMDFKHPPVLSRTSYITELLIREAHIRAMHSGVDLTLTKFLANYWCPRARRLVKGIILNCPLCKRDRARCFPLPDMPPWPENRVKPSSPFSIVGLDYFGPMLFKAPDGGAAKVWVVIFTCLSCRAVHLEPVDNMEAEGFLLCFRRFVSRRGIPQEILSDHGTQLVLARQALLKCPELSLNWGFIPQLSPWAGGVYERLVAIAKGSIRRGLGRKLLIWSQFETFIIEVESIMNERPITFVSDEPDGPIALRPVDFLRPRIKTILPDPEDGDDTLYKPTPAEKLTHLWWATNRALREFWAVWSSEYLLLLRGRTGTEHRNPRSNARESPQVGHIVLVEQDFPKTWWPLGRILELHGPQGRARSATVLMPNGRSLIRPINKLVPLEVTSKPEENNSEEIPVEILEEEVPEGPPIQETEDEGVPPPEFQLPPIVEGEPVVIPPRPGKRLTRIPTKLRDYVLPTILGVILFFGIATYGAPLTCTRDGIYIRPPDNSSNMEICCGGTCVTRGHKSFPFLIPLPPETLITGYQCSGTFRDANLTVVEETKTDCAAVDVCILITCTICWDRVLNPECTSILSSLLIGLLLSALGLTLTLFICLFCVCKGTYRNCRMFLRLLSCLWPKWWSIPLRYRIRRGKDQPDWDYEDLTWSPPPRRNRRWSPLTRLGHVLALLFLNLGVPEFGETGMEVISMTAKTEECWKGKNTTECKFNSVTSLTLLPAGQQVELVLKSPNSDPLGTFSFTLEKLSMTCVPSYKGVLRPYRIETFAEKRCPGMGSCKGNHCGRLLPNETVLELKDYESYPGNNFCIDSTSFLTAHCGGLTSSCLYYRPHVKWLSDSIFYVFECPTWNFAIQVYLKLEIPGRKPIEETEVLLPGRTFRWEKANISITPSPLGQPPMPALGGRFIFGEDEVALVPTFPLDLFCTSEKEALAGVKCKLEVDACTSCHPDHDMGNMRCLCREVDLEGLISHPSYRLPMTMGQVTLYKFAGALVRADVPYTPVNVITKMEGVSLTLLQTVDICTISIKEVVGCYRCATGGKVQYSCKSTISATLAAVSCEDGTNWAALCSPNGTDSHATLNWNHPNIHSKCWAECPGGKTDFILEGTLVYLPPQRERFFEGRSRPGKSSGEFPSFNFSLDIWGHVLSWATGFPQNLILLGAFFLLIFVIYLFIKFNPAFRTYRILARMIVLGLIFAPVEANPSEGLKDNFIFFATFGLFIVAVAILLNLSEKFKGVFRGLRAGGRNKVSPELGL